MKSILQMPEFKVGLLVLVVAALIAVMSMRVSEDPTVGGAKTYWFLTPNASDLVKKSSVKMAGIPVGIIKDIRLSQGIARLEIVIREEVDLRQSARVEIKASGILGDKYVEISPGSPEDPPLGNGEQILNVNDKASMDGLLSQISDIGTSLKMVALTMKESIQDEGNDKHILGRIVKNIDRLTADLANITHENRDKVNDILAEIHSVTKSLDNALNGTDTNIKRTWARLDKVLENIEMVTAKINNGEGTVGKLINDEKTIQELNAAVEGINNMLDLQTKMQTSVDFRTEFMEGQNMWKSYLGLKVQPGPDRFYYIQIVDDPTGVRERSSWSTTSNPGGETKVDETRTNYNRTKLTLLFGKNFHDFTVRGGLIENSGGLGFDYSFFRNRFQLTAEAFNFSSANVRAALRFNLIKGVYFTGGVFDALNKNDQYSSYMGVGLFFTNDDLKYLMTSMPF